MVIDFSFIVYSYILILAVGVTLLAAVFSLATWGLIKYMKRVHERQNRLGDKHVPRTLRPPSGTYGMVPVAPLITTLALKNIPIRFLH